MTPRPHSMSVIAEITTDEHRVLDYLISLVHRERHDVLRER